MTQPKLLLFVLVLLSMFIAGAFFGGFIALFLGRTRLQVLKSQDGQHEVELIRSDHLDRFESEWPGIGRVHRPE